MCIIYINTYLHSAPANCPEETMLCRTRSISERASGKKKSRKSRICVFLKIIWSYCTILYYTVLYCTTVLHLISIKLR